MTRPPSAQEIASAMPKAAILREEDGRDTFDVIQVRSSWWAIPRDNSVPIGPFGRQNWLVSSWEKGSSGFPARVCLIRHTTYAAKPAVRCKTHDSPARPGIAAGLCEWAEARRKKAVCP